jgi:hypothetical protein
VFCGEEDVVDARALIRSLQRRRASSAKVVPDNTSFQADATYVEAPPYKRNGSRKKRVSFEADEKDRGKESVAAATCRAAAEYQAILHEHLHERCSDLTTSKIGLRAAAAAQAFADFCCVSPDPPELGESTPNLVRTVLPPPPSKFESDKPRARRKASKTLGKDGRTSASASQMEGRAKARYSFAIGEKVERRDRHGDKWGTGYVTALEPLLVTVFDDPRGVGFAWNEVRPFPQESAPSSVLSPKVVAPTRRKIWPAKSFEGKPDLNGVAVPPMPSPEEFASAVPHRAPTAQELHQELVSMRCLPLAERKQHFMMLCRRWHPDKNSGQETDATKLFQTLQEDKAWFLSKSGK